jgi:hypothetical protein
VSSLYDFFQPPSTQNLDIIRKCVRRVGWGDVDIKFREDRLLGSR